jgi:hypothetical protein
MGRALPCGAEWATEEEGGGGAGAPGAEEGAEEGWGEEEEGGGSSGADFEMGAAEAARLERAMRRCHRPPLPTFPFQRCDVRTKGRGQSRTYVRSPFGGCRSWSCTPPCTAPTQPRAAGRGGLSSRAGIMTRENRARGRGGRGAPRAPETGLQLRRKILRPKKSWGLRRGACGPRAWRASPRCSRQRPRSCARPVAEAAAPPRRAPGARAGQRSRSRCRGRARGAARCARGGAPHGARRLLAGSYAWAARAPWPLEPRHRPLCARSAPASCARTAPPPLLLLRPRPVHG